MRHFDLNPKVSDDSFDVRTDTGGMISLGIFIFMGIVAYAEFLGYKQPVFKQLAYLPQYNKSSALGNTFIHFNVTIAYPCHMINVVVSDTTGNHRLVSNRHISRQRLDTELSSIGPMISDDDPQSLMSKCGGCLGAPNASCCLTCTDIASSFKIAGKYIPNLDNVEQCTRDCQAIASGETCQLVGDVSTLFNRGSLIFEAGGVRKVPVHYKYDLTLYGNNVNFSHWVNELRFGPSYPGMVNPLDKIRWAQRGRGFFKYTYTLNLVPTIAVVGRHTFETNQYSAMFTDASIPKTLSKKHPELEFMFTTSPVAVKVSNEPKSRGMFVIHLCAILGGGFTLGGLIDRFFFRVQRSKKLD